jgi:hypothetical protein
MDVVHPRGEGFRKVEKWRDIQEQFAGYAAAVVINYF